MNSKSKVVDLRGNPIKPKAKKMYNAVKEHIDTESTVPRLYLVDDTFVQVLPSGPNARYPLDDMVLHAAADQQKKLPQGDKGNIPLKTMNVIQFGAAPGEVPRHKFFGVIARLKEADLEFTVAQIVGLLKQHPDGIAKLYPNEGRLELAVKSSYDKADVGRSYLPMIDIVKGQIHKIIPEIDDALQKQQVPLFSRGGKVVMPITKPRTASRGRVTHVTSFAEMGPLSMVLEMAHSANFQSWKLNRNGQLVSCPADPPKKIASMMVTPNRYYNPPTVVGIATVPLIRADGSILQGDNARYDSATQMYYVPNVKVPPVPDNPTGQNALAALAILKSLLKEFAFKDGEAGLDRAVALSAILTAGTRGAVPCAPMHFFLAHCPGLGKSYIVDLIHAIFTGRPCPVVVVSPDREELRKTLSSLVRDGVPIFSLDNISFNLDHDLLCQILTQVAITPRILGATHTPELDCKATVFATGNNVGVTGDAVRRSLYSNLDTNQDNPEKRTFTGRPVDTVMADRGKYIAAVLTIVRAYIYNKPGTRYPEYNGYDEWGAMVRGPLIWLGERDPLDSQAEVKGEDPLRNLVQDLFDRLTVGRAYTTAEIAEKVFGDEELFDSLKDKDVAGTNNDGSLSIAGLGKWIAAKVRGRTFGDSRLERQGSPTRPKWSLKKV
jgi:putative DNA primase/helicase